MRKFILKSLYFSLIFLILWVTIACIFSWAGKYTHTFLDGYGQKERLLSEVQQPRIIFQGGSNVTFGIDSKAAEDSMHMNTLNIALQAGIGMRLMLSEVSDFCSEGDILVLSPEYQHFYGWANGRSETIAILTLLYPKIIKYFNINQIINATKGMPVAFQVMRNALTHILDNFISNSNDLYSYTSQSFNSYGDEVKHWTYNQDGLELWKEEIPDTFDEEYFDEFCETIDSLEARGITVLIIPPSVYSKFYEEEKEKMNYVAERLQNAGHPFEFGQEQSIYERDDMFDSPYHLNKSGIDKRMELIIGLLRNKFQ